MAELNIPERVSEVLFEFERRHPNTITYRKSNNQVTYLSEGVKNLLGIGNIGRLVEINTLFQHLSSGDRSILLKQWKALLSGSDFVECEVVWRHERRETHLCISATSLFNGEYIVAFVKDITSAKNHENYLVEFGIKKDATLDSVLHFMSGAITLTQHFYAEAGKNLKHQDIENIKELLDLINQNSEHCLEVINSVTRDEYDLAPVVSYKYSRVDLIEKVKYILDNLATGYPERRFEFEASKPTIVIETDDFKLLQVINNLIFNAIKFSRPDEPVTIRINADHDAVLISVADNGIGIPSDLQPYIFDRHSIAGRKGLNGEPSHGIGLSICKQIVTEMSGRIWFESKAGAGCIFYVSLPQKQSL